MGHIRQDLHYCKGGTKLEYNSGTGITDNTKGQRRLKESFRIFGFFDWFH